MFHTSVKKTSDLLYNPPFMKKPLFFMHSGGEGLKNLVKVIESDTTENDALRDRSTVSAICCTV